MAIPQALRNLVLRRAGNRCEYCGLSQVGQEATFHVDRVVPVTDGGPTEEDNLALACVSCSLKKVPANGSQNQDRRKPSACSTRASMTGLNIFAGKSTRLRESPLAAVRRSKRSI